MCVAGVRCGTRPSLQCALGDLSGARALSLSLSLSPKGELRKVHFVANIKSISRSRWGLFGSLCAGLGARLARDVRDERLRRARAVWRESRFVLETHISVVFRPIRTIDGVLNSHETGLGPSHRSPSRPRPLQPTYRSDAERARRLSRDTRPGPGTCPLNFHTLVQTGAGRGRLRVVKRVALWAGVETHAGNSRVSRDASRERNALQKCRFSHAESLGLEFPIVSTIRQRSMSVSLRKSSEKRPRTRFSALLYRYRTHARLSFLERGGDRYEFRWFLRSNMVETSLETRTIESVLETRIVLSRCRWTRPKYSVRISLPSAAAPPEA